MTGKSGRTRERTPLHDTAIVLVVLGLASAIWTFFGPPEVFGLAWKHPVLCYLVPGFWWALSVWAMLASRTRREPTRDRWLSAVILALVCIAWLWFLAMCPFYGI